MKKPVQFRLQHGPPLYLAMCLVFDGVYPLFDAKGYLCQLGLPPSIYTSRAAQTVSALSASRLTATGLSIVSLWANEMYGAVDMVMLGLGVVGIAEGVVLWKAGSRGMALWKGAVGFGAGMWGLLGMTQVEIRLSD